jgi:hypothetical protein
MINCVGITHANDAWDLFGLLLLPHLLQFAALTFDLLLLLFHLALRLLLLDFLILHRIANRVSTYAANGAADRRACCGMADSGANQGAGAGAEDAAAQGSFFAGAERLSAARG